MPNPFEVLGELPVAGGACWALDAGRLGTWPAVARATGAELAVATAPGGAGELGIAARAATIAVRRRAGDAVDEVLVAASASAAVPVAPLVETGLMGALPDPAVAEVELELPSGVLALVAPAAGRVAHARAHLVHARPGRWRVSVARMPLPRDETVVGWIFAAR